MVRKSDFGLVFWIHLLVILFWYSCPFLFSWYWLLIGVAFSYLQGLFIGGCVLTYKQFGKNTDETFFRYYFNKLGIPLGKKVAKIIFFWIEPIFIFLVAVLWQVTFGNLPILI
ncbi:hypothetical protein KA107_01865 [Candidatus Pacearchaeota archaeon]|nr:hypothetical protein [Candidatus Pacearchaeota archaeon]